MTRQELSSVIDTLNRNDNRCQGAPQQVANGLFRLYDLLKLIIGEVDKEKKTAQRVALVDHTLQQNARYSQSAYHESANAGYRVVELLRILIEFYNSNGEVTGRTGYVIDNMNRTNAMCQGAPGQIANGFFRIVDMLKILASVIAPELNVRISSIISDMERLNRLAQSAPQQGACGSDAIANIAYAFANHFDTERKYVADANSTITLMNRNNNLCQGADQQSANYLYRAFDFCVIIAKVLLDKAEQRTKQYWEEHAEERQQLLDEKQQLNKQIQAIQLEAQAVTDNGRIAAIQAQIHEQIQLRDNLTSAEIPQIEERLRNLIAQRDALGFFAFKEKKRLQAEINAALAEKQQAAARLEQAKVPYQTRIQQLSAEIKNVEAQVEVEKERIRAKTKPLYARIAAIDVELTRQR